MKHDRTTRGAVSDADILGNTVLRNDIEKYENNDEIHYDFNQSQRDALIAHARADAASAFGMSWTILGEVNRNKIRLNLIIILLMANLLVLLWIFR